MTEANSQSHPPRRQVVLIKAHSAGIGDLLRSSAAWRAWHEARPGSRLHVWFLSADPGAPAEQLLARHHLLDSFRVSDKRTRGLAGWRQLFRDARALGAEVRPDLVVDCEPNGLRTSLLARYLRLRTGAVTVGIAQTPLRRFFYQTVAPSTRAYARRRGLPFPLEYTERDFVVLTALGIERRNTAIELRETTEGRAYRQQLLADWDTGGRPWLGVNVGCGTPDALPKRPDLDLLAALVAELQRRHDLALLLTGAPYEAEINRELLRHLPASGPRLDLAGRTNLLELTGALAACRMVISSDSGPYHMAVGLRVPTLAIFNQPNPQHYHHHDWVACRVAPGPAALPDLLTAAEQLWRVTPPPLPA